MWYAVCYGGGRNAVKRGLAGPCEAACLVLLEAWTQTMEKSLDAHLRAELIGLRRNLESVKRTCETLPLHDKIVRRIQHCVGLLNDKGPDGQAIPV